MKKIIFATGNADKMKEIREILSDLDAEILSMKEAGIQADIVEDGQNLRGKCCDQSHRYQQADRRDRAGR